MIEERIYAVVLLSGGLDSTTVLAMALAEGRRVYALSFDYGQRHGLEIVASKRIVASCDVAEHRIVEIDLRAFGGSALTDSIEVPKDVMGQEGIPVTYVPARNTIFLAYAVAWAEVVGADEIWIGVNAVDYSGYPDCRPEFIEAFQRVIESGTKAGVEKGTPLIVAPLIALTKAEIIRKGLGFGVDYSATHSCYDPDSDGAACGHCDSCLLRKRGFEEAGVEDPTTYR